MPASQYIQTPCCPSQTSAKFVWFAGFSKAAICDLAPATVSRDLSLTVPLLSAGFLGTKDQQRTVYGLLAVVWGAIAAAKILATEQFFEHVFAIANPAAGLLGLQRLSGFSALAPAIAAYTLVVRLKFTTQQPWHNHLSCQNLCQRCGCIGPSHCCLAHVP